MSVTLKQWLQIVDAEIVITGSVYSPSNTFINVSIKQNESPYNWLRLKDSTSDSLYGRAEGTIDTPPELNNAIQDLMNQITGQRVCFERDGFSSVVPEFYSPIIRK